MKDKEGSKREIQRCSYVCVCGGEGMGQVDTGGNGCAQEKVRRGWAARLFSLASLLFP